jgi:GT2 family glycosyltransferase
VIGGGPGHDRRRHAGPALRARAFAAAPRGESDRDRQRLGPRDRGRGQGTPPGVDLIELGANRGAAARNVGVARAGTPYVGLANDSWWAPGSLAPAADVLDSCPRVAVLAARVLVGESQRLDPHAPNADRSARHPDRSSRAGRVGFMACGAVVRRNAFLRCGGFDDIVFFVGEEERGARSGRRGLCTRLRASVVAHHHPSPVRVVDDRRPLAVRNVVLVAVLRRPLVRRPQDDPRLGGDAASRAGLLSALPRIPRAWARRRRLPGDVETARRTLDEIDRSAPRRLARWPVASTGQ